MKEKQLSFIVISAIITLFFVFGIYHSAYRKTRPTVPSIITNEPDRQDFIDDVWEVIEKELKNKDKGYLDANNKITNLGKAFIKKTVKATLEEVAGKETVATDERIKVLEDLLVMSMLASYHFLKWCPCMLPGHRVDLVFQMINDIKKQFPDPTQKLVYVSLGSGDLLQDFIVLATLIDHGYCNLDINGIDFKYKHIVHTTISNDKKQKVPGVNTTEFAKEVDHVMHAFTTQITDIIKAKPQLKCAVDIEPFTSAYTYIEALKKGLEPKASVIVLVDPTRKLSYFKVDNFKDANIVSFSDNGLLLFMPEHQKPKAYLPLNSSKQYLDQDLAKIKEIIDSTLDNNYRAQLKNKLVDYIKTFNTSVKRSLAYYADPFITFQDLIHYAATPATRAYGLYEPAGKDEPEIISIDVEKFKNEDVITGYAGRDLTEGKENAYKSIDMQF